MRISRQTASSALILGVVNLSNESALGWSEWIISGEMDAKDKDSPSYGHSFGPMIFAYHRNGLF